jgi:two-component system chemotaxis response regulator CheY
MFGWGRRLAMNKSSATQGVVPAVGPRNVLVVSDDPRERKTIDHHLACNRFFMHAATNYHAAVRILEEMVPSVLCVNLRLPNESGYRLIEHVRAERRLLDLPVLVLSDIATPMEMAYAEELGADAMLKKPFSGEQLVKYVRALLYGPRATRPSFRHLRRTTPPPIC